MSPGQRSSAPLSSAAVGGESGTDTPARTPRSSRGSAALLLRASSAVVCERMTDMGTGYRDASPGEASPPLRDTSR